MTTKPLVLLFEDTLDNAISLGDNLAGVEDYEFRLFEPQDIDSNESFVQRLTAELKHYSNILLIISDMDLSKTDRFKGLNDAVVLRVAQELGIPTAYYSTALGGTEGHRLDQAGDGRILLGSTDYKEIAHRVDVLAKGFLRINNKMQELARGSSRPASPAMLVAELIGRTETADRVNLYLSGDQRMAAEILSSPKNDEKLIRHSTIFGTWIYDSLMRYPGVLLNSTAAASYLNVSLADFANEKIQQLFEFALYSGPFVDDERPLYWRDLLDNLIADEDVDDGLMLVRKQGFEAKPCMCSVDNTLEAGYYCMVTEAPVSFDKSVGNISLFPPGADLARLAEPIYEELSPWIGV
ncbi:hypothetical protein DP090_005970 [Pseudomonas sp. MDMC216]|nr:MULTISPECIES: hypothetical protein [unclassified Pseudomonas]MBA4681350.1 hypothetical protein [Pseudomonas sp.]MDI5992566.1 hypothetical protein [Pseudomonas sp. MDMC216]MDI6008556.1 hypothetical protein [Pseudomonas sp. MDMC17]